MIQLLLVDDEPVILEDLAQFFHQIPEVEHLYTAVSGQEAMELLNRHPIDIVVTDIRMPGMSGIELCEYVDQSGTGTLCILLSGYAEFEYAQQALKTKAAAYLLKPVKKDELLLTVRQAADALQQKREAEVAGRKAQQTLRTHLLQLQAALLRDLLSGRTASAPQLVEEMGKLDIPFVIGQPAVVIMLRIENRFLEYDERSISLFEFAIVNIAEELIGEQFHLWACKDDNQYLTLLAQPRQETEEENYARKLLDHKIRELQSSVTQYLQGHISAAMSDFESFPESMSKQYLKLLALLRKLPGSEQSYLLRLWDQPPATPLRSLQRLYEPPTVLQLMEAGRWSDAEARLGSMMDELAVSGMDTAENMSELFYYLSNAFTYMVHASGLQLADVLEDQYGRSVNATTFRSVRQLHEWAIDLLQKIRERTRDGEREHHGAFVKQIHQYIEQHLSEDVTLQAISEHVRLHPTYISAMYKQETGENLSEYIYRFRMDKAAYLLRNTNAKIYEIAAQIGYQYTPYFTKLFKSYYGASPQEYRKASV
ncbi:response regulator [Paenibacillus allorhizosphaerae]|uniref:HTH-type transcriptional activator RhaS n=1 Tax=Paenibacillus allorhizosphaerae TaxID=2849866 RepID=A0ABN7TMG7_9BACL|nr:response regulator [Paenibacillus allorhizosphaerae]CAG7647161.1 HTH-type transcriptional activator RhaS [Paenibacillus allorhizosphaerae]